MTKSSLLTWGNPLGLRKGQMHDRDISRFRRQKNETKHLLRKLRERGLSNGELSRLHRVSGRAAKAVSQLVHDIGGEADNEN